MKNWKTAPYSLSNNVFFFLSACFVFCYLITPSIETRFNINTYKLLFVIKQYHAQVTLKYFCLLFIIVIIHLLISVIVYLPIYLAWMNFSVGLFGKIDKLSKMCNLDNSCKILTNISHSQSHIYAKIPSRYLGIS